MKRYRYDTKEIIRGIEKYAKERWQFAYMLLDIKIEEDIIVLRTITFPHCEKYHIYLKPPYDIKRKQDARLFEYFDRVELKMPKWYNKLDTHVNSAKWLEKYPYLCRWGHLDSFGVWESNDDGSVRITQINNEKILTDYFITYEKWRQATADAFRILPLPITDEINKFMFFLLATASMEKEDADIIRKILVLNRTKLEKEFILDKSDPK